MTKSKKSAALIKPGPSTANPTGEAPLSQAASASYGKIARILALLSQADGAALEDITTATDWQKHAARAALSGLKKQGHTISRYLIKVAG